MGKAIALFEVLGVFIVGNFVAGYLSPLLGVKSVGFIIQLALNSPNPDFVTLGFSWMQAIGVQYACLLAPAFAIGWWRRRWRPAHYGITQAGSPVLSLIVIGLIAFALVALPQQLLWVAKRLIPLDSEPPFWKLLDRNWTLSFWLFLAIASFALTPCLEELFFRGYCQTRLEENFGGVGAILIVSLFMTLGHNQYHHWSILSIGQIFSLIPIIVGMGYVFWRTRSILPAVILHGAVNVPTKGIYAFLLPATMIVALIGIRRTWWREVQNFYRELTGKAWRGPALGGTLLAITMTVGFEAASGVFVPLAQGLPRKNGHQFRRL
jgi:membrane protease YdiL (CAAX protease family)